MAKRTKEDIGLRQALVLNAWALDELVGGEAELVNASDPLAPLRKLLTGLQGRDDMTLEPLVEPVPAEEGLDSDGLHTVFVHYLSEAITAGKLDFAHQHHAVVERLLEFDAHIVEHTAKINEGRGLEPIRWKYYQWLALMVTELYLCRWFEEDNHMRLCNELNDYYTNNYSKLKGRWTDMPPFKPDSLNKVAFWMATGSGKTLLMHVNIKQWQFYLAQHPEIVPAYNGVVLITPNEALTRQHLLELKKSGIQAEPYSSKGYGLFNDHNDMVVRVTEITKLTKSENKSEKERQGSSGKGGSQIEVEGMGCTNLVLIDEGHRGSGGQVWKENRDALASKGFAMEYSATFGQSVAAAQVGKQRSELLTEYAQATLMDYNYRWFNLDGYGKALEILDLDQFREEGQLNRYLTSCLMAYAEQIATYEACRERDDKRNHDPYADAYNVTPFSDWLIERPLLLFAGATVNAAKVDKQKVDNILIDKDEYSDVVKVLMFLSEFVRNADGASEEQIRAIMADNAELSGGSDSGLHDAFGRTVVNAHYFDQLRRLYNRKDDLDFAHCIYQGILKTVFRHTLTELDTPEVHIDRFEAASGELGLRIGAEGAHYFGIVNVGSSDGVAKLCKEKAGLTVNDRLKLKGMFATLNEPGCQINMLIGSRKFAEGWNSWRVSTMGLLNMGKNEGSQIIQLLGRGVRLKGYQHSLLRSSCLLMSLRLKELGIKAPAELPILERLNIFAVKADYLKLFKKMLENEGIPVGPGGDGECDKVTVRLPVVPRHDLAELHLRHLVVNPEADFRTVPLLLSPPSDVQLLRLRPRGIELDYNARVFHLMRSKEQAASQTEAERHQARLTNAELAWVDWTAVWLDLENFKRLRGWRNLRIDDNVARRIMDEGIDWYNLYIAEADFRSGEFLADTLLWTKLTRALLRLYIEKFYRLHEGEWLGLHMHTIELHDLEHEAGCPRHYDLAIDKPLTQAIDRLIAFRKQLDLFRDNKALRPESTQFATGFRALNFEEQLYVPLINLDDKASFVLNRKTLYIGCRPLALNSGEGRFVCDLHSFLEGLPDLLLDCKVFLLRNESRKGTGFFVANHFYPDFILWLVKGHCQHIAFIDPKGIRQLRGIDDPKIQLHREIKKLEKRIRDSEHLDLTLDSYIVSRTTMDQVDWWQQKLVGKVDKMAWFNEHHVMFQQQTNYIALILSDMLLQPGVAVEAADTEAEVAASTSAEVAAARGLWV